MGQLALKVRNEVEEWKQAPANRRYAGYVHDAELDDRTLKLPDEVLEVVVSRATAKNLQSLGYKGTRETGKPKETLVSFYTAVLYQVRARYGDDGVKLADKMKPFYIRGVKDEQRVKDYFLETVDKLTLELLRL